MVSESNGARPHYQSPSLPVEQLIEEARGGCADAAGRLLQDCRDYLLVIAGQEMESGLGPKAGASDVVQDTMLSAQRCLGDFHGQTREELLAWLRGILLNDIRETRRRYRTAQRDVGREQRLDAGTAGPGAEQLQGPVATPTTEAIAREEVDQVNRAMARLASTDRDVIRMRNLQHLSFAEIGSRLGRSADAARKLWSRAILRLQDEVDRIRE